MYKQNTELFLERAGYNQYPKVSLQCLYNQSSNVFLRILAVPNNVVF